jgi:hypothetical protein
MPRKKVAFDPEKAVPPPSGSGLVPPRVDADRAWLGLERKYRVAEYESLTVSLGASTSVDPGETVATATRRVFDQLIGEFRDVVEVMRGDEGV